MVVVVFGTLLLSVAVVSIWVVGSAFASFWSVVREVAVTFKQLAPKMVMWLFYSAAFPFVALSMRWQASVFTNERPTSLFNDILESGELLYGAAGLSFAAIGEILLSTRSRPRWLLIILGGAQAFLVFSALFLGNALYINELQHQRAVQLDDSRRFAVITAAFYTAAVLLGVLSIYVSGRGQTSEEP
jgi:hypothetical protein